MQNKNLSVEESLTLAVQNHQKNNFEIAQDLYEKILKISPSNILKFPNLLKAIKLIFAEFKISSIPIKIAMAFRRVTIPKIPKENNTDEITK